MDDFDALSIVVAKDELVTTRDGSSICVDVFRPDDDDELHPAIVCMSPYSKDASWLDHYPDHGFSISPWAVWETPDPGWWVPSGYCIVRVDSRGIGKSPGTLDPLSTKDTEDYYDVIEWVATQPYCSGNVGLLGISFYAIVQWKVAALHPPHLKAIVPWEGMNDLYRDKARQGGIFSNGFVDFWWQLHFVDQPLVTGPVVDHRAQMAARPLADEWYEERSARLEEVEVPLLSAGNWGAFHSHLRGNVEGFGRAGSTHKRLVMMAGSHVDPFFSEWGKAEQLRFLDHYLRGEQNGADHDPPVRLAIRYGHEIEWRDEQEWPLARTSWSKLYLDAASRSLAFEPPERASSMTYDSPAGLVRFETAPAIEELEITGPLALYLVISTSAPDTDLFVVLRLVDADGSELYGIGPKGGPVPMALGWLRASHRELDEERSLPYRPWHTHRNPSDLVKDEPTPLVVEIWPTSIVVAPGQRLRLEICGNDDHMAALVHNDPHDRPAARIEGEVTCYSGGEFESYLLVPVIPADPQRRGSGERIASAPRLEENVGQRGRVHTRLADGGWVVELEGYGQISRHTSRALALAAGRERAERSGVQHVVHREDGSIEDPT